MSTAAATSPATRRLLREMSDNAKKPNPAVADLGPVTEEDLTHWTATLLGPPGSIYAGCSWKLDIKIPDQYPHAPPAVKFLTPCCHPNIHLKVCVCLLF